MSEDSTEKRCVRCGREGHLSKDCPWPLALPQPEVSELYLSDPEDVDMILDSGFIEFC